MHSAEAQIDHRVLENKTVSMLEIVFNWSFNFFQGTRNWNKTIEK